VEWPQHERTSSEELSPADFTGVSAEPLPSAASSTEPEQGPDARPFQSGAPGGRPKNRSRSVDPGGERTPREPSPPGQPATPHRPIDRGPRKRRPPRDRIGLGRRGDSASRLRPDSDRPGTSSDREDGSDPGQEAEWPTVRDILANHRSSPGPRPAVERRREGRRAIPTVPREPGQWNLPAWLALPPVGACVLSVGFLACAMSWWWAIDSGNAGVVALHLLSSDGSGRQRTLPAKVVPPRGRWFGTTAQHLAHWGIYLAWAGPEEKIGAAEAPSMLGRALEVSPLNATARMAMAQLDEPGPVGQAPLRGLGLSRDSVSLAWSARRLLAAGKKETALRLYSRALSAAAGGGLSRTATPRWAEDSGLRRSFYFLPAEDSVRDIVAELAAPGGLEFREWSAALPHDPIVLLATARLLREQGSTEADPLLDRILGDEWTLAADQQPDPRLLAARAEALVLGSRWREAAEQYRRAIERVDNDLIRRSWWFNLADIAQRLQDEPMRQAALRSAVAVPSSDEITRRVSIVQKSGASKSPVKFGSAKAN
jgi:tetratricopeptide (TPR) repeat protein